MHYGYMSRVVTSLKECPKFNSENPKLNSARRSHSEMNTNNKHFFTVGFNLVNKTNKYQLPEPPSKDNESTKYLKGNYL